MYICPNCQTQHEQLFAFCSVCGAKMDASNFASTTVQAPAVEQPVAAPVAEQPIYQAPVAEQPIYQAPVAEQPVYNQPPVAEAPVYQQPVYQQPVAEQPVYQQPVAEQPVYNQAPVYQQNTAPEVEGSAKVKGFIGMGLSIGGVVMATIGFIAMLSNFNIIGVGFACGLVFGIFGLPLSIVGMILSGKAIEAGFVGTPTKLGKIFGLVGTILSGVSIFLSFISLAVADRVSYSVVEDIYDYYY